MVLVEAVVNKFSDSLAVVTHRPTVVKVKTLAEKLALVDILANRHAEMRFGDLARHWLRWRLRPQWTHCSRPVKRHSLKLTLRSSSTNCVGKNQSVVLDTCFHTARGKDRGIGRQSV